MNPESERLSIQPAEQIDAETLKRAAGKVLLLPNNWPPLGNEPVYAASTESLRKLYFQKGIDVETLTPVTPLTHLEDLRALDWISPTLLVTSLLMTQNPGAVTIALNIISSYVTEIFKGIKGDPQVKLTVIQTETNRGKARKIRYIGPVSGLNDVLKVLTQWTPED
jgi:hypothetical protein